jgi:Ras-related protein Rab-11A
MKGIKNVFSREVIPTVGFEFLTFVVKLNNTLIKLQIWDTCGQEVYKSLVANFYRQSSLALMVYSIENRSSFENIDMWMKELKNNSNPDIKIFLVGNKSDLEYQ